MIPEFAFDRQDAEEVRGPKGTFPEGTARGNAVKHGLSSKRLLPAILGKEIVEQHYQLLRAEWQPATPTQEFLVREMARHEAALQRSEEMETAVLRRGALGAPRVKFDDADGDDYPDAALAGAGTSDAIDKLARYRRAHERAYLRSLKTLREAKTAAGQVRQRPIEAKQRRFRSEATCEAYLVARLADGGFLCPACCGNAGMWIASRKSWQCRGCRRQMGIRGTTVMERSRAPLCAWFCAIETLLVNPSASTAELSLVMGIRRAGTVRRIAEKIRQALSSPQKTVLLAGLDQVFGAEVRAEQDVLENAFLQNSDIQK